MQEYIEKGLQRMIQRESEVKEKTYRKLTYTIFPNSPRVMSKNQLTQNDLLKKSGFESLFDSQHIIANVYKKQIAMMHKHSNSIDD